MVSKAQKTEATQLKVLWKLAFLIELNDNFVFLESNFSKISRNDRNEDISILFYVNLVRFAGFCDVHRQVLGRKEDYIEKLPFQTVDFDQRT